MTPDRAEPTDPPISDHRPDVVVVDASYPTPTGTVPAQLFLPPGGGRVPGVVLAPEAYGPNTFTRQVAAALAHLGYATLLPDYYRGEGPADTEAYTDFTEVVACIDRLDFRQAALDVMAGLQYLEAQPSVRADRMAVWGYCTGATLAMMAASLRPELAAAVLFFPSQPVFERLDRAHPVHPIDLLWNVSCPLLVLYGDQDVVMPPELLGELEDRLETWGIEHTVRVYPGAGHAFTAPVPPMRHDGADRESWAEAVDFLAAHLA